MPSDQPRAPQPRTQALAVRFLLPFFAAHGLAFTLSEGLPAGWWPIMARTLPLVVGLQILGTWRLGLHRAVSQYAGLRDVLSAAVVAGGSVTVAAAVLLPMQLPVATVSVLSIDALLAFNLLLALRLADRGIFELRSRGSGRRVVVVGAGDAGEALVRALRRERDADVVPVAMLDDDPAKRGRRIHGVEVLGRIDEVAAVAAKTHAESILIAICSQTGPESQRILALARSTGLPVQRVPTLRDLIKGDLAIHQLQTVPLADLLPRDPVQTDRSPVERKLHGRRVLVTGGAGSIGSELCRQILSHGPASLVMVDINETALFHLEHELADSEGTEKTYVLASVQDRAGMDALLRQERPEIVFHAAAYKHVPVLEHFPEQAVTNNVAGTQVVAELAHQHGVDTFVLISTDKAVQPTSVMGTTKRVAELLVADLDRRSETRFVTIRFGNVLGSNGSVLQLFRRQIAHGGPVTVTHPDIRRYFMTIPEAVELVLFAASMQDEGSTFILDMGEQVRILDMARHFIRMCGLEPGRDVPIEIVGLRPGEKLYEELWLSAEEPVPTRHPSILRAPRAGTAVAGLSRAVQVLIDWAEEGNRQQVVDHLRQLVPEYSGHPVALDRARPEDVAADVARQVASTIATVEELRPSEAEEGRVPMHVA